MLFLFLGAAAAAAATAVVVVVVTYFHTPPKNLRFRPFEQMDAQTNTHMAKNDATKVVLPKGGSLS